MPFFKTQDGCSLYFETHGFDSARPLVVFLNGIMQTTVYWKMHVAAFEDRFQVLLYDARAQGQSDSGERKLSLENHAADLVALLDHVGVEKADLVGLSHGAKVALACAAHFPERVGRVVLCSVGAKSTCRASLCIKSWLETLKSSGLEEMVWAALPIVFGENFLKRQNRILDSMVKAIVKRNTKEAIIAQLEAMTTYPPLSAVAQTVRVPCMVISASDDPLVTQDGAGELAMLCGGDHEHITGAGHSFPTEAPELFSKTVLRFLDTT